MHEALPERGTAKVKGDAGVLKKDYMRAYEDMIRHTATKEAPWYVVPADNKWFTRLAVAAAVVETLDSLDLAYPRVGKAKRRELDAARRTLLRGKG